jgi:hypothetical protein
LGIFKERVQAARPTGGTFISTYRAKSNRERRMKMSLSCRSFLIVFLLAFVLGLAGCQQDKAVVAECGFPAKIYFEVDKAVIGPEGMKVIKEAAACIKEKKLKVDITGYTDKSGDLERNLELAKNRAKAVQDALVADGLPVEVTTLKPPMFITITGTTGTGTAAEARRVEINKSVIVK